MVSQSCVYLPARDQTSHSQGDSAGRLTGQRGFPMGVSWRIRDRPGAGTRQSLCRRQQWHHAVTCIHLPLRTGADNGPLHQGADSGRNTGIHHFSMPAHETASILSDDYWSTSGRKAKKANQRNPWSEHEHEGEKQKQYPCRMHYSIESIAH